MPPTPNSPPHLLGAGVLALAAGASALQAGDASTAPFRRIASFPVFLNTDVSLDTVAEIVASTPDGMTLVYTDGLTGNIGFVDIADPAHPLPAGVVAVDGEPTSVAVRGDHALAAVDTSVDFVNTSGVLQVIDVASRTILRTIELGGQPDAIAVSPDGRYAAIAIENERDEDLGDGKPPQAPPGYLVIVDCVGDVAAWTTRVVDLVGVADLFPEDPEPEFVDVNAANQCVVTLQENNHVVVVDLVDGAILADFSAGTVDLADVDTDENDLIEPSASLAAVPREPDGVAWISDRAFATADEGDLFGGSRGYTIFGDDGSVLHEAGSTIEHLVIRHGHYPESRSENKGCEPEGVEFGVYGTGAGASAMLFVGSERSSVVAVYAIEGDAAPRLLQVLPAGVGPEGLHAIPQRDLFVAASEEDARGDGIRSTISIYARTGAPNYPTVVSADRTPGIPIPWAALSGLAIDPTRGDRAVTVHDSYYRESRIFTLDLAGMPATIDGERTLRDENGVMLAALLDLLTALPDAGDFDPADVVNADGTVNVDLEGVAMLADGTFWVASEGAGNLDDGASDPGDLPFTTPNLLIHATATGVIDRVILLPLDLTLDQLRFGFEGVAIDEVADVAWVCFQRAWTASGDPSSRARIGRCDLATETWTFAHYPLDAPASPAGGWVGLSEITIDAATGDLILLERDNQAGSDAAIKRIYATTPDVPFVANSATPADDFALLSKRLVRDVLAAGDFDVTGGVVPEKLEGLLIRPDGRVLIVNDNDGVDDSNGETQLLDLGPLLAACAADLDGNGSVGFADLVQLLAAWGEETGVVDEDLDADGAVGVRDLVVLLAHWGPCP